MQLHFLKDSLRFFRMFNKHILFSLGNVGQCNKYLQILSFFELIWFHFIWNFRNYLLLWHDGVHSLLLGAALLITTMTIVACVPTKKAVLLRLLLCKWDGYIVSQEKKRCIETAAEPGQRHKAKKACNWLATHFHCYECLHCPSWQ